MMNSEIIKPNLTKYLFRKADKYKVPLSGAFEISPICNMDCKMCYVKMSKKERDSIGRERSIEEWINLAEQAKSAGTLFLLITGGEPFLQPYFKDLYIKLYNMGFILSINTNGTLIDEECIEWLSKYPPMRVNITLYGASNKTYDRLCNNPKGFDQVSNAIKLFKDAGITVKLNASMTQYNEMDIEEMHKFAEENNLIIQATSYMYPPIRKDKDLIGKNDRFTPKEAAINTLKINQFRLSKESFIRKLEQMKNRIDTYSSLDNCNSIEGDSMKCRAGVSTFWITWDGRMISCGMMNDPVEYPFKYGFLNSWNRIVNKTSKLRLPKECSTCKNKSVCKACAATCYTESGCVSKKPTYMCEMTTEIINQSKKLYKEIIDFDI